MTPPPRTIEHGWVRPDHAVARAEERRAEERAEAEQRHAERVQERRVDTYA